MAKTRERNKCEAERILEQVLVTAGKSHDEIQKIFQNLYDTVGASKRRNYSLGTYSIHKKSKWNRGADPKVKDYLDERIYFSKNPLPLGSGGQ